MKNIFSSLRKNKKKTSIILLIALISIVLISFFHIFLSPKIYLAIKYDTSISEIQIESYTPVKHHTDFNIINYFDLDGSPTTRYFSKEKWNCKINDRDFETEYYNFHFVDDYQLEDIFEWCTDYLKENIDKNIIGFSIDGVAKFNCVANKKYNSKDAKELITEASENENKVTIYYRVDNIKDYGTYNKYGEYYIGNNYFYEIENQIKTKLSERLCVNNINVIIIDNYTEISRNADNPYSTKGTGIKIGFKDYVRGK